MKENIGKFLKAVRQKLFAKRVQREIYAKILPHLRGEANHGYAFNSDAQIAELNKHAFLTTESTVRLIERAASKMPKLEGDAFRHIVYRDLQRLMWQHVEFAHERMQPTESDTRLVATRAIA